MERNRAEGLTALTEKEKDALRLILRGHDAKSMARHLGLSVHTINERLRTARRKMAVSSSREAARLLLSEEGEHPHFLRDNSLGDAVSAARGHRLASPDNDRAARARLAWIIGGTTIMSLLLAALLLQANPGTPADDAAPAPTPPAALGSSQSAAAKAAQRWLELLDAGDWRASWLATAGSFQELNTLETWTAASERARAPLGAVRSRSLLSHERVPAPPHGYEIVRFRTSFAHRADAVETVSLERDGEAWKVAGITIE